MRIALRWPMAGVVVFARVPGRGLVEAAPGDLSEIPKYLRSVWATVHDFRLPAPVV